MGPILKSVLAPRYAGCYYRHSQDQISSKSCLFVLVIQTSNITLAKEVPVFKHWNKVTNIASYGNIVGFGVFFSLLFWVRTYFWHLHFHPCLAKLFLLVLLIQCEHEAKLFTYHRCMSKQRRKSLNRGQRRGKEATQHLIFAIYYASSTRKMTIYWNI